MTLSVNQRYELWRGVTADGGLNFSWTQITTNSAQDNFRPYIPRRNGGERCVLWFRGSYASYTSYSCSVVGLFTTAVPTNAPPAVTNVLSYTYVDATSGVGGNTTFADGSVFSPPLNTSTAGDNLWKQRTVLGSGGNIFESGGDGAENAAELRTTITNLVSGARYAVCAFLWDATGTTENWSLRAGFGIGGGTNPLFAHTDIAASISATAAPLASTLAYAVPPTLFVEANRALLAAQLGTTTADTNGTIRVYLDDRPSTIGANARSWYDGVGWALNPALYATNLSVVATGSTLKVSWPATHFGWTLQWQTNGLGGNWIDLAGTAQLTATNLSISPAMPAVFYRLRYP